MQCVDLSIKINWLRGQDLNLRPSGYEPEIKKCNTLNYMIFSRVALILCHFFVEIWDQMDCYASTAGVMPVRFFDNFVPVHDSLRLPTRVNFKLGDL